MVCGQSVHSQLAFDRREEGKEISRNRPLLSSRPRWSDIVLVCVFVVRGFPPSLTHNAFMVGIEAISCFLEKERLVYPNESVIGRLGQCVRKLEVTCRQLT